MNCESVRIYNIHQASGDGKKNGLRMNQKNGLRLNGMNEKNALSASGGDCPPPAEIG